MWSATPRLPLRASLRAASMVVLILAPAMPLLAQGGDGKELAELRAVIERQRIELNEQRRRIDALADYVRSAPGVEVLDQDYATARARFKTRLVRHGPPPDKGGPITPPSGVSEVLYASGALRLKAWVNRPVDASHKLPAVLFLHGGFEFTAGDWEQSKPYRDAGFVVLTPMLRGENGQPGAFSYFYDEVDDVLAAAEYLRKQPYVDAQRVFLAGHSVGGTLTLLSALASSRFRAAASFSGAPFWPEFSESSSLPFDRRDRREIQLRSPIAFASSFKSPLRMYYGTAEAGFFALMSRRTAALARQGGLDVEAIPVEGDHGSHVAQAMLASIAFFRAQFPAGDQPNGISAAIPPRLDLDLGANVALQLVRIEPGTFKMGSPPTESGRRSDEPLHDAEVGAPFAIGVYTVTQRQYRQVMGLNPSRFSPTGDSRDKVAGMTTDDFPVENVSWKEAMDFCRVLSLLPAIREKGWVVDLPTEAEWEYAARATTQTPFNVGSTLSSSQANFNGNNPYGGAPKGPFLERPAPVGSYAPNAWGLYDMHGNVLQWTSDWYDPGYEPSDTDRLSRVARGGFWGLGSNGNRSARRTPVPPHTRGSGLGFRVVVRQRARP